MRVALVVLGVAVAAPAFALAQNVDTEVASALDKGDSWDVHATVDYSFTARNASIKRELAGPGNDPDGPLPVGRDLDYRQTRHTIMPRLAFGIFHDLELYAALPIVIVDKRSYEFDDGVDAGSSSTLRDGLLPGPDDPGGMGFDARDPNTNFGASSDLVFRGIDRKGLDQVHLGLNYALLNQLRDDTKPTWVLGVEMRLSVGKIARFDRMTPFEENGVSEGLHELHISTGFSRRLGWAEPFLHLWWRAPVGKRGDTPEDEDETLYWDVGYGQGSKRARQRAGTIFGFQAIPWSRPEEQQEIAIVFRGRLEATFEGRGYSEMWEPFAYAGDRTTNPDGPLVLDAEPISENAGPLSHPGVTKIENYLTMGGSIGISGRLGRYARFDASFEAARDQTHRISFTDAGIESSDDDNVVTPGTSEVNPLHVRAIDLTGRRYVVHGTRVFTTFVSGSLLF